MLQKHTTFSIKYINCHLGSTISVQIMWNNSVDTWCLCDKSDCLLSIKSEDRLTEWRQWT